jgi:hypothetical protein
MSVVKISIIESYRKYHGRNFAVPESELLKIFRSIDEFQDFWTNNLEDSDPDRYDELLEIIDDKVAFFEPYQTDVTGESEDDFNEEEYNLYEINEYNQAIED